MPVMAIATSAPNRSSAPRPSRPRPRATRPRGARSAPDPPRAARSSPRSSRSRRLRPRRRTHPAARSAGRPSGHRCTTPPWRSSCRRAASPPARRRVLPSVENSVSAWRSAISDSSADHASAAAGSWRTTTSTSPRRRQVVISRPVEAVDRLLGRAQRLGDLGLGDAEQPQHRLLVFGRGAHGRRGTPRSPPPGATCRAARAAGRAAPPRWAPIRRAAAPPSPGRCRPARSRSRPRAPAPACGSRRGRPRSRGCASASSAALRMSAIRCSSASSRASGRPVKRATTSSVRSSAVGPRPPLVTIRSTPWASMKASWASMSSGRSPQIVMWASSTPSSSRRSDSHGPLRSLTRPVSTSVPVTTMPARALTRRVSGPR